MALKIKPIFLFTGWVAVSCLCITSPILQDEVPQTKPNNTGTPPDTAAQTREALGDPAGEPYRVAAFPSGKEIFLLAPQAEAVVADPWVDVIGTAPADTVITLNEEIAVAGTDGMFYAHVPLEEGLNEIQCVASDLEGDETYFDIIIVYEPEG
jgi:hypothetical protein